MELQGCNALVSGGAVRLGRAVVSALASAGCNVAIHYGSSAAAAEELADGISSLGVEAAIVQGDLADAQAPHRVVEEARRRLGTISVLINNAAIFPAGTFASTELESWERQFAINLRAPFLLCRAFHGQLDEDGEGAVVNVVDARVCRPGTDHFAYRLTKQALAHMTEILALDLAPRVRVNAIAPGALLEATGDEPGSLERRVATEVPLARPGGAEVVARAVLYLLGEDFATGTVIRLDGGEYL